MGKSELSESSASTKQLDKLLFSFEPVFILRDMKSRIGENFSREGAQGRLLLFGLS
jgi:hypothetical protein